MIPKRFRFVPLFCLTLVTLTAAFSFSQETTGGLQGTMKDPSGAVVAKASLELTG